MGTHGPFLLLGAAIAVAAFLIWWLIFETEGVYLGRRAVVALYDLYAARYDRIKQFDETADIALISQPLLDRIAPLYTDPLILDVATGTGRVPLVMARNARFHGHVIGLDASKPHAGPGAREGRRRTVSSIHFAAASMMPASCLSKMAVSMW